MPNRTTLLAACAVALLTTSPARALELVSTQANGHGVSLDFSTAQTIAADIGFVSPGSITLTYALDAGDVSRGSASFNSIVDNFTGGLLGTLSVRVSAGAMVVGAFESNDGAMTLLTADARSVTFEFAPLLETQAYLGDSLLSGTATDWTLDLSGLAAGDTLSLTVAVAVPEPGTWAMVAGGLGLFGLLRRRRA